MTANQIAIEAVKFLANKHNVSEAVVAQAILEKNAKVCEQFEKLMVTGIAVAMKASA